MSDENQVKNMLFWISCHKSDWSKKNLKTTTFTVNHFIEHLTIILILMKLLYFLELHVNEMKNSLKKNVYHLLFFSDTDLKVKLLFK